VITRVRALYSRSVSVLLFVVEGFIPRIYVFGGSPYILAEVEGALVTALLAVCTELWAGKSSTRRVYRA
jgi:hypothetical protein